MSTTKLKMMLEEQPYNVQMDLLQHLVQHIGLQESMEMIQS